MFTSSYRIKFVVECTDFHSYIHNDSHALFLTCDAGFRDFGFDPPRDVIYNTGLTTFNNNGEQMLMSELIRVTGHELGHNWGSHHDPPGDPNCRDRWLMNEFAQDGSEDTHMVRGWILIV